MNSFDQLAKSAYQAHTKKLQQLLGVNAPAWDNLQPSEKACWVAVAEQLWAEFAAIH